MNNATHHANLATVGLLSAVSPASVDILSATGSVERTVITTNTMIVGAVDVSNVAAPTQTAKTAPLRLVLIVELAIIFSTALAP